MNSSKLTDLFVRVFAYSIMGLAAVGLTLFWLVGLLGNFDTKTKLLVTGMSAAAAWGLAAWWMFVIRLPSRYGVPIRDFITRYPISQEALSDRRYWRNQGIVAALLLGVFLIVFALMIGVL